MARVITFPRTNILQRQFEDLPLYSERAANGEVFAAGFVDGTVDISYSDPEDWWISRIRIKVDNGRMGSAVEGKVVDLSADDNPSLYWHILDVFENKFAHTIGEEIAWHMLEAA